MSNGWIKSLQCKSKAFNDVYNFNSYSCIKKSHCVKDVIDTRLSSQNPKSDPNLWRLKSSRTESELNPPTRTRQSKYARTSDALTELPYGHPSRNVVEIILQSSWSSDEFLGRIEMMFKMKNGSRTVTRFEEYREVVKSRACLNGDFSGTCEEDNLRCLADSKEMMRFYPIEKISDGINGGAWGFSGWKCQAVCMFSGSGEAREQRMRLKKESNTDFRVIADRVATRIGFGSDFISVVTESCLFLAHAG